MSVIIVLVVLGFVFSYIYSKFKNISFWTNIKQSSNFILFKLIVFFIIIGVLCSSISMLAGISFLSTISTGSYILSAIFFVVLLFRIFFKDDIERNFGTGNSGKWICPYCGAENPNESKFCRNCGKEHI